MAAESPLSNAAAFPEPLPLLEEVAAAHGRDMPAALGFALARLGEEERPALIVATRRWLASYGRPFPARAGPPPLLALPRNDAEALWAMEQALRSCAVAGVVGMVEAASLTQTRRLDFAAKLGKCGAVLLRAGNDGLSAARRRWRVSALPSAPDPFDAEAPGRPRLLAELVRRRDGPPGAWIMEQDDATDRLRLADRLADRGLVEDGRADAAP